MDKQIKSNVLGIIPARGGSKRVKNKNIRELNDKPLIAYTIEAAKSSQYISELVLSSDDKQIIKTAERYDCPIHERPDYLGKDKTPMLDVIINIISDKDLKQNDLIVLLQPTSPLRNWKDIDNSIEKFLDHYSKGDAHSLISVCEFEKPPYWAYTLEGDYLKPLFGDEFKGKRSQDLPKAYRPNGAIYISPSELIKTHKSFRTDKTIAYKMPIERSVDIDTEFDFKKAEFLLKNMEDKT